MSNTNASIFTKDNVTLFIDGKTYIVGRQFAEFAKLTEAVKARDWAEAEVLADRATTITKRSNGAFNVANGVVLYNGKPIHNVVTQRILEFTDRGLPVAPLTAFLDNLMENPSARAVAELYTFLEHRNLPITEDGHFLAYKSVRSDFLDKFSGSIDNSVGQVVIMTRNLVDDEANRTCSHGLHVGALEYSGPTGWYHRAGDNVVVVKVNPRDAVSVPADHNAEKLRVCRYEVIALFQGALSAPLYAKQASEYQPVENGNDWQDEDEIDECSECGADLNTEDHFDDCSEF